jgi:hypothetical protein
VNISYPWTELSERLYLSLALLNLILELMLGFRSLALPEIIDSDTSVSNILLQYCLLEKV